MNASRQLSDSVAAASELVIAGFDDYNASFSDFSRRGKRRFESGDRAGMHAAGNARLELYDQDADRLIGRLDELLGGRLFSRSFWKHTRTLYGEQVKSRLDAELYKTWFNTIIRRLFKTRGVDQAIEFVALDIDPTDRITHPVSRHVYSVGNDLAATFDRILSDYKFAIPYHDRERDARCLARHLEAEIADIVQSAAQGSNPSDVRLTGIELLETVFYREGRAYLVGRAFARDHLLPCVIALVREEGEIRVDAVLCRRLQVSILFGFTFSYFLADLPTVGDAVVFLRTLLPDKPVDELYTVLGRAKQGKTERYRAFFRQLQEEDEARLVEADGKRGMVMMVFTLPSYPLVFKLLRDRFDPAKKVRRNEVIERYHMVYRHDRVGRLLDAQEFKELRFPLERCSQALLDELLEACSRLVTVEADSLVVQHCWVERRVRPLNLFLEEVDEEVARGAIIDMGQTLKDLARSNIFAGDLLPKNFGVTRSGRVVFYDYDELLLLTDCRFRRMPKARDFFDHYSPEPWFSVEENDVFPEEISRFIGLRRAHKDILAEAHPELFEAEWWSSVQDRIRSGEALDVPPYNELARLRRR